MKKIYYILITVFSMECLTARAVEIYPGSDRPVWEGNEYSSFNSFPTIVTDESSRFILYIDEGVLNIKYGKPQELVNGEVIVYNILGMEIIRKKLENSTINQVPIPLQNTCYIIKINYSGKVHTQKIVVSNQ
jgi:hypothetical protein